jgi:hypothetical protein
MSPTHTVMFHHRALSADSPTATSCRRVGYKRSGVHRPGRARRDTRIRGLAAHPQYGVASHDDPHRSRSFRPAMGGGDRRHELRVDGRDELFAHLLASPATVRYSARGSAHGIEGLLAVQAE